MTNTSRSILGGTQLMSVKRWLITFSQKTAAHLRARLKQVRKVKFFRPSWVEPYYNSLMTEGFPVSPVSGHPSSSWPSSLDHFICLLNFYWLRLEVYLEVIEGCFHVLDSYSLYWLREKGHSVLNQQFFKLPQLKFLILLIFFWRKINMYSDDSQTMKCRGWIFTE